MNSKEDYEAMASALDAEGITNAVDTSNSVIFLCGKDLTPEPVEWLWQGWLAKGKLHILAGAPGQGKTTLALTLAATVTIGGRWPDGRISEQGNILIWSGEDDAADTLLPRLIAAGADRNKCFFVQGTQVNGEIRSFEPSRDMLSLELKAKQIGGISLLVVDPVVSTVIGDSHKNTEVRRDLQPVVDLASRLNAAVIGITHFSKGGSGSDPAMRVVGSVAFTAVARIVLVAAKVKGDEGEKNRRIFARAKSNIGPDDGGFEYFIEQIEPLPGIHASRIAWGQALEGTAKELLSDPEEAAQGDEGKTAIEQAKNFLEQILADGLTPSKVAQKEARENGISARTLRRAYESMNVLSKKGAGGVWYWSLPAGLNNQCSSQAVTVKLSKQDDQIVHSQNIGQDGQHQSTEQTDNDGKSEPKAQDGHVVQDLKIGQVGQLNGQVVWNTNDTEIF